MKKVTSLTTVFVTVIFFQTLVLASKNTNFVQRKHIVHKAYRAQVPFTENRGQIENKDVSFYTKTMGGTLFVGKDGNLTYNLLVENKRGIVIKEIFAGKAIKRIQGLNPSSTVVNYFKGKDRKKWRTHIPSYGQINIEEIYKGVNLTLKAYGNNVEKLFSILPKESPKKIKIKMSGAKKLKIDKEGRLEVITDLCSVKFTKPIAFQTVGNETKSVEVAYVVYKDTTYGFKVGSYDSKIPLIIDPLLASTIIGTVDWDFSWSLAVDASDNLYISSSTASSNFPTTTGAYDETHNGENDVYIAKFDSTLSTLLACTYIGGSSLDQTSHLTLDGSGNVYATGLTESSDFPTTSGAYDESYNGGKDVFVVKLDSDLSNLLASTYLGGGDNDRGHYVDLDQSDNVVVAGYATYDASSQFPTTTGAYDETQNGGKDVFVSKLNNTLTTLIASTLIGGEGEDEATGMTFDGSGNIYLTGAADVNFPATAGAYDESNNGGTDGFVIKMTSDLTTILASTYIGGSGPGYGYSVKVTLAGEIYIAGETFSLDFPTTPGAYSESWNGGFMDVFVSKFDSSLSTLLASTFLGGNDQDWHHHSLIMDGEGNIYVNGLTKSNDFPTTPDAFKQSKVSADPERWDCYISKFDSSLSTLLSSTFFGGDNEGDGSLAMAFDSQGNIFLTGWTRSSDFPSTPGAYDESYNGDFDAFASKLCIYGSASNFDCDSIPDGEDNCPTIYNPGQEDTFPPQGNGIGDACDCECDFDCSGGVDAIDVGAFLVDFGRSTFFNPCTNADPCSGDSNCDGNVDALDVNKFLEDFGRSQFNNPCPACVAGSWCIYP